VIEPPDIIGDADLESLRVWDDRWECCVWEGNARVRKRMTMERYTALGHLIYSMGGSGQPVALPDIHLARIEVSVESFLLAAFLLRGTDLVTLIPKRAEAFLRRTGDIRVLEAPIELPRSSKRSCGTPVPPPTRPTHGCERGSVRSPTRSSPDRREHARRRLPRVGRTAARSVLDRVADLVAGPADHDVDACCRAGVRWLAAFDSKPHLDVERGEELRWPGDC
jgi:hypothetical protein